LSLLEDIILIASAATTYEHSLLKRLKKSKEQLDMVVYEKEKTLKD